MRRPVPRTLECSDAGEAKEVTRLPLRFFKVGSFPMIPTSQFLESTQKRHDLIAFGKGVALT
jgi:hypothetical protein